MKPITIEIKWDSGYLSGYLIVKRMVNAVSILLTHYYLSPSNNHCECGCILSKEMVQELVDMERVTVIITG